MFLVYANFVDLESLMLISKFQDKQNSGYGEDFEGFLPYGGHLGHVSKVNFYINLRSPF